METIEKNEIVNNILYTIEDAIKWGARRESSLARNSNTAYDLADTQFTKTMNELRIELNKLIDTI